MFAQSYSSRNPCHKATIPNGYTVFSSSFKKRRCRPLRHSPLAAGAAARAQALERSGRAQRGRAPAGRAFDLYLAGSASGRQNQKWKARGDGGGRTKWTAKGWRALRQPRFKTALSQTGSWPNGGRRERKKRDRTERSPWSAAQGASVGLARLFADLARSETF